MTEKELKQVYQQLFGDEAKKLYELGQKRLQLIRNGECRTIEEARRKVRES